MNATSLNSLTPLIPASGSLRAVIRSSPSSERTSAKRSWKTTTLELEKIRERVARGALQGAAAIGVKLGRVLDKYKVGKHFELTITDTAVKYQILQSQVAAEAALDGIYVIRTGLPKKQMSAPEAVRSYKALTQVERAFRSLKTVDLKIRPNPSSAREPSPCAHLPVHARLLRRMAPDRSVASAALRR